MNIGYGYGSMNLLTADWKYQKKIQEKYCKDNEWENNDCARLLSHDELQYLPA